MKKGKEKKQSASYGGLSIKWKLVAVILPIVLLSIGVLALITTNLSKRIIMDRTKTEMEATLGEYTNYIGGELDGVKLQAQTLANSIGGGYKTLSFEQFDETIQSFVSSYDTVLGAGIWFEPNVYDAAKEYYGPYWIKEMGSDGTWSGKVDMTWDYSGKEYDYFNQEYYKNAKSQSGIDAVITNPYVDETSGLLMASCSAPIKDSKGNFLGCVTVTLELTSIQNSLAEVSVGETGSIWLIDSNFGYVYHPAVETAAKDGMTIDDSTELAEYIEQIKSKEIGNGQFKWQGDTRMLYWDTITSMGWKMGLTIKRDEILADVNKMIMLSIFICIIAMILSAAVIMWQASGIASVVGRVQRFAENLAKGDFTVDPLNVSRKDEIGAMSSSLNTMYENNSDVIRNIGDGSGKVSDSSMQLSETSTDLLARFEEVSAAMTRVNDAMTNTGAATEQVSASANEVNTSVQRLADEMKKTKDEAVAIEKKAAKIESESRSNSERALSICEQRGEELKEASQQAEVVNQIATLADSIADIASQINLLSLNASIEAARAGEHGRGFAVVAGEINTLASQTKSAVDEIQETVSGIQDAFHQLNDASMALLDFITNTGVKDYENFVVVAHEYGEDAQFFGRISDQISEMVAYISESMEQVNAAVASIAESATETASSSAEVTDSISESAELMEKVNEMANDSQMVSENLDEIVKQFKLLDE